MNEIHFSTNSVEWSTPEWFFERLDKEFHFTLDPCATDENHKCEKYYTEKQDGLAQDWGGETVFCNPPYGKKLTEKWVKKCAEEAQKARTTVVLLIPARTDTKAFHEYLYNKENVELRFVRGRLKFGEKNQRAPFPSLVAVIRNKTDK